MRSELRGGWLVGNYTRLSEGSSFGVPYFVTGMLGGPGTYPLVVIDQAGNEALPEDVVVSGACDYSLPDASLAPDGIVDAGIIPPTPAAGMGCAIGTAARGSQLWFAAAITLTALARRRRRARAT